MFSEWDELKLQQDSDCFVDVRFSESQTSKYLTTPSTAPHQGSRQKLPTPPAELNLEREDPIACRVMVFYIMERNVPQSFKALKTMDLVAAVHCWALCDKYGLPSLQNIIMRVIIEEQYHVIPIEILATAVRSLEQGAKMRMALVDELVLGIRHSNHYTSLQLGHFDGIAGFLKEVGQADYALTASQNDHGPGLNEDLDEFLVAE